MRNLARHCETLVEDMTPIKRTLPSPSPGPSHQSIPAILVCRNYREKLSDGSDFSVRIYTVRHKLSIASNEGSFPLVLFMKIDKMLTIDSIITKANNQA